MITEGDIDTLTKAQLEENLKEYQILGDRYFNYEQSVKRILNSIYGAFGNEHFYFFNLNVAESITLPSNAPRGWNGFGLDGSDIYSRPSNS